MTMYICLQIYPVYNQHNDKDGQTNRASRASYPTLPLAATASFISASSVLTPSEVMPSVTPSVATFVELVIGGGELA